MKRMTVLALSGLLTLGGGLASAEVVKETTTRSETTYKGTVSEFAPGSSTIVLKSESGPVTRYRVTEQTTFVDPAGNVVSRESIVNQPVIVHYTGAGDSMTVSKIVVTRPGEKTVKETTVERRSSE